MKRVVLYNLILFSLLMSTSTLMAQEENHPFTYGVGQFNITVLPEGQRQSTPDRLLGVTEDMIKELLPDGTYTNAVNAFMIEYVDKTVLVDAGYGRELFNHLEVCGKKPEDIGGILLTHMHGDHIGGLLKNGERSFPNAILYISQIEHDYWMSDEAMQNVTESRKNNFVQARNVINAYKQKLQLFTPDKIEKQEQEILPGIKGIEAYGHTPGHTAFLLEDDGFRFLIWGDLTHAVSVQVTYPEVAYAADTNPVQSSESRQQIFNYLSKNNEIWVGGMHIEHPGMGEIKGKTGNGYKFTLLCTCEGLLR